MWKQVKLERDQEEQSWTFKFKFWILIDEDEMLNTEKHGGLLNVNWDSSTECLSPSGFSRGILSGTYKICIWIWIACEKVSETNGDFAFFLLKYYELVYPDQSNRPVKRIFAWP